jgi:uncharacterized membrane protein
MSTATLTTSTGVEPPQAADTNKVTTTRVPSIDALRGLVMIIMALDHTREFLHASAQVFQPEDLTRTSTVLFFTRWVTHICAPVFFFTAGLGAFFWKSHGRTNAELTSFLWKRGVWLALLDLTVMRYALTFRMTTGIVILSVLWALGLSMITLAFLSRSPIRWLATFSIMVVVLHNLTDSITADRFGSLAWVWYILHQQGVFNLGSALVLVAYPLVPWFAVMALGYCFGLVMQLDEKRRRRWLTSLGLALIAAFLLLRGINHYGDPQKWSSEIPYMTVLSFLRRTKYPASLDFLLMTLGPAFLLLAWFDKMKFDSRNPLIVFGRVPLFYFILHFYLIRVLAFPLAWGKYGKAAFLLSPMPSLGGPADLYPASYGYQLGTVYLAWIVVVLLMYPVCLWFSKLKARSKAGWLSYL